MTVLKERGSQGGLIRARTQKENDTIYIQKIPTLNALLQSQQHVVHLLHASSESLNSVINICIIIPV